MYQFLTSETKIAETEIRCDGCEMIARSKNFTLLFGEIVKYKKVLKDGCKIFPLEEYLYFEWFDTETGEIHFINARPEIFSILKTHKMLPVWLPIFENERLETV